MCGKEMVLASWDFFSFLITYLQVQKRRLLKFGRSHDDLTNKEITAVNRWLPKPSRHLREIDLASLYGEEPTLKLMVKYEKFSTICHLTSCKKVRRVIEDNSIDPEIRTFDSPLAKESVKVRSVGFETNTDTNLRELKKILEEKKGCGSSGCLVFMAIQVGVELCLFFSTRSRTDGSSSSCEMIILRNKSHGGIIRVCMGIFTAALRNKKIQSNSHTPSLSTRGSKTIYWCQVTVCSSARHSLQRRQG